MAVRKSNQSKVAVVETEVAEVLDFDSLDKGFGEYAIEDFDQRQYKAVYYAIREIQGLKAKKNLEEAFNWDDYKATFAKQFGTPEEPKLTLEQLIAYSLKKLGKNLEQLLNFNRESWNRRNARESVYAEEFGHPAIAKVNEILANVAANAQAVLNEPNSTVETLVTNVDEIPY